MDEQEERHSTSQATPSDGSQTKPGRRRGRRRRGNRGGGEAAVQEPVEAAAPPVAQAEVPQPRTGNAAKPKRRNAQPRAALPDFSGTPQVTKATAVTLAPLQPMRLRKIDPQDMSEPIIGCPMLTRTRLGIPFRGGQRVARCSVGWSVHDEDEVLFCMHTPTAAQCWKEHPEQVEVLAEKLRPIIEAELSAEHSAD